MITKRIIHGKIPGKLCQQLTCSYQSIRFCTYSHVAGRKDHVRGKLSDRLCQPDIVFSGINRGYNAGVDILYSGTVGAAMEALVNGIPAIAFSNEANDVWEAAEEYLLPIAEKLLEIPISRNRIWNVNFPGCSPEKIKGILWDRLPSQVEYYQDHYVRKDLPDGSFLLTEDGIPALTAPEGTDMRALLDGYISVGQVRNMVLREED